MLVPDDDFELEPPPFAVDPDEPEEPEEVPPAPLDDEGADVAAPELPPLLVTTTWTGLALVTDFPIRKPTPSASSTVAMPAITILVEGRWAPAGRARTVSWSPAGCSSNRGLPRRVPHSTQ